MSYSQQPSKQRARFYDPATNEFISKDPLEFVDGMSMYRGYFVPNQMDPIGSETYAIYGTGEDANTSGNYGIPGSSGTKTFFDRSVEQGGYYPGIGAGRDLKFLEASGVGNYAIVNAVRKDICSSYCQVQACWYWGAPQKMIQEL